jgi:hypothetical protein
MATALEQLSCENPEENPIYAAFFSPIRAIFGLTQHETLFFYAWIVLITIWLIIYYVFPISALNSSNGFRSGFKTFLSTLLVFSLFCVAYVLWTRETSCKIKRQKALYYVKGIRPAMPKFLETAVKKVQSMEENQKKPPMPWQPQVASEQAFFE